MPESELDSIWRELRSKLAWALGTTLGIPYSSEQGASSSVVRDQASRMARGALGSQALMALRRGRSEPNWYLEKDKGKGIRR